MFLEAVDPAPAYAQAPHSAEISVLTYNVRGLPWPIALRRGEALKRIGQELGRMREEGRQPDVVLVQEGFRDEMSDLVKASGYPHWVRGPRREGNGKATSGGLHVLSDIPIVAVRAAAFSDCAGFDCLANKGVMLVRLAPEGQPFEIEVVNAHFNARRASAAPLKIARVAHNHQTDQFTAFVRAHRDERAPLLVGGDFNIKHAPERYYHAALERPYTVVSEVCGAPGSGCGQDAGDVTAEPWLAAQDLQGFAAAPSVRVRPVSTETVFGQNDGRGLSDHDGYLVRYRLTWSAPTMFLAANTSGVEIRPKFGAWGVKVSWKR